MRQRIQCVGHGADQCANGTGLRRSDGATAALIHGAPIGSSGVDEHGIHGTIEQHQPPFHFLRWQLAELFQRFDVHKARAQGLIVRGAD